MSNPRDIQARLAQRDQLLSTLQEETTRLLETHSHATHEVNAFLLVQYHFSLYDTLMSTVCYKSTITLLFCIASFINVYVLCIMHTVHTCTMYNHDMSFSLQVKERQRIINDLETSLAISQDLCNTLDKEVSFGHNYWYSTCVHIHNHD